MAPFTSGVARISLYHCQRYHLPSHRIVEVLYSTALYLAREHMSAYLHQIRSLPSENQRISCRIREKISVEHSLPLTQQFDNTAKLLNIRNTLWLKRDHKMSDSHISKAPKLAGDFFC